MMEGCGRQVVCLGFFDGVHLGHLALLQAARRIADEHGWPVCVHTFDHAPAGKGTALTTLAEREALLLQAGADRVAQSAFDDEMRCMRGDDFFRRVVLGQLRAGHVICGDDHRFGYRGAWGVRELAQLCREAGVGLTVVPPVCLPDGTRISTTAIKGALARQDWPMAEAMLGRPVNQPDNPEE